MVSDFMNPTIFWEYDTLDIDVDAWPAFVIKQVFNRNMVSQPSAIPALIDYYGHGVVEAHLRLEMWLTREGVQTACWYFPHLESGDFRATERLRTTPWPLGLLNEPGETDKS